MLQRHGDGDGDHVPHYGLIELSHLSHVSSLFPPLPPSLPLSDSCTLPRLRLALLLRFISMLSMTNLVPYVVGRAREACCEFVSLT